MSGMTAPYAFVSYASVDYPRVDEIVDALIAAGKPVWIDRSSIDGGASYGPAIVTAIRGSNAVIIVCSTASMHSRNVRQEIAVAWKHQRPYIPLLLEPLTVLPEEVEYWLEGAQWIEVLDHPAEEWLPKILHALDQIEQTQPARDERDGQPTAVGTDAPDFFRVPAPLSATVGRQPEIAAIQERLATSRLLTLTGPGGTGKTRLAIAVAHEVRWLFPDGVVLVDLAPLHDPELVIPTIATALSVQDSGDQPILRTLSATLEASQMLLVLDNLEQVAACGPAIAALLARCPRLRVLATSRVSLHLTGEQEYPVQPLAIPDTGQIDDVDRIAANDAVALFVQQARSVRPAFALTAENVAAVVAICQRLDGLPLAIEIAAARCKVLTPQALLSRLEQPLKLLVGGARDLPARQQTIRATIEWSYNLLEPPEQHLLRQLGVFVGGWTVDAVEAIADPGAEPNRDPLDSLAALVDHSLVKEYDLANGDARFGMLATIREFALEQLDATDDDGAYRRHSEFVLQHVIDAEPGLRGPQQPVWFQWLFTEQDNVRALMSRSFGARGDSRVGLRAATSLAWFWFTSNQFREGREWLQRALECNPLVSDTERARLDLGLGLMEWRLGDYPGAQDRFEHALRVFEQTGDRWNAAFTVHQIAHTLDHTDSREDAIATFERSIATFRSIGDTWGIASTQSCLARSLELIGRVAQARSLIEEALPILQELGDEWSTMTALQRFGDIELAQGQFNESARRYRESIVIAVESHDEILIADALVRLAQIGAAIGQPERAAQLFGAAGTIHARHGISVFEPLRPTYDRDVLNIRAAIGNDEMSRLWQAGQRMSLDEAIMLALESD